MMWVCESYRLLLFLGIGLFVLAPFNSRKPETLSSFRFYADFILRFLP
uniref:Uncharacterized protein n=1 Tax=Solanum lycopersicum TaxID=4081 RepID=K4D6T0_SOLLC